MQWYAENPVLLKVPPLTKSQVGESSVTKPRKTLIGPAEKKWLHQCRRSGKEHRMRYIVSAALGLWLGLGTALQAESQQGLVVELYTSQGCSSCPPADEHFAKLVQTPGIIALSLHVDYWDYIGWADTFANAKFTERQKRYAHAAGSKMIYTPQLIVNGRDRVEGNQPSKVSSAVAKGLGTASEVSLTLIREGEKVLIRATSAYPIPAGTRVQVVRYTKRATVDIERGENAGQSVTYHNIVTSWADVGEWSGGQALEMSAKAAGGAPVVVIIQAAGPAEILAAAQLD